MYNAVVWNSRGRLNWILTKFEIKNKNWNDRFSGVIVAVYCCSSVFSLLLVPGLSAGRVLRERPKMRIRAIVLVNGIIDIYFTIADNDLATSEGGHEVVVIRHPTPRTTTVAPG